MATDTNINNTTLNSMDNNIDNDKAAFFYYGIKDAVQQALANLAPDDFEMLLRFLVHDIEGRLMAVINSNHDISLAVFLFKVYRLMRKRLDIPSKPFLYQEPDQAAPLLDKKKLQARMDAVPGPAERYLAFKSEMRRQVKAHETQIRAQLSSTMAAPLPPAQQDQEPGVDSRRIRDYPRPQNEGLDRGRGQQDRRSRSRSPRNDQPKTNESRDVEMADTRSTQRPTTATPAETPAPAPVTAPAVTAPRLLAMPDTWEEICKTYMSDTAGAQREAISQSMEYLGVWDETCQNCEQPECAGKGCCPSPCAACGKPDCFVTECKHLADKCNCSPRPMHLRQDCPLMCRICWQKGGRAVAASTCETHCAPCGQRKASSKHDGSTCGRSNMKCPLCLGVHFTQDCPLLVCRNWFHDNYCWDSETCNCCRRCGHPDNLPSLGVDDHTCQWTAHWETLKYTQSGRDMTISAPLLKCRADEKHLLVAAHILWPIREAGYGRLSREMAEYAANNNSDKSSGKNQESPLDTHTRPVIECAQCFTLRYEGGDYTTQTPGQLRPKV